jgi:phosphoribosylaminoimidazolecarboxamide formyltransferase/IMP cyclohydrolase
MIKRALLSVSDKTGLIELGKALKHFQIEILSTGGTAQLLNDSTIKTISISDYTGFPEMMEGRLKTLHPKVHGALLGRRDHTSDLQEAQTYGIEWIDLVVVNLYPFEKVVSASARPDLGELIENIDIGGPTMIRAAAKNYEHVLVVVDPKDYPKVIQRLKDNPQNPFSRDFRYQMAVKAFRATAIYDSLIAETLSRYEWKDESELIHHQFPLFHSLHGKLSKQLRYGENPHQKSAYYKFAPTFEKSPLSESLQGKETSYNNILDSDAAWRLIQELPRNSCAILKHNNPCGVGLGDNPIESYKRAFSSDSESAFGGVVVVSGEVDQHLAKLLCEPFFEIICAESFTVEARDIFQSKKNLRLMMIPFRETEAEHYRSRIDLKKVTGGYLIQDPDQFSVFHEGILGPDAQVVTERAPTEEERTALCLGWVIAKNARSNAVVITNQHQTLGIGCGQVNRRFASEHAARRASLFESPVKACASDGFFPFADSIEALQTAQVTAIAQPGGSIRDAEVIEACNKAKIAMIFTKARHFSH